MRGNRSAAVRSTVASYKSVWAAALKGPHKTVSNKDGNKATEDE